jgi:diguanylate cyclase (GGDEF)-like protein/PAS domain S-box-containing protein
MSHPSAIAPDDKLFRTIFDAVGDGIFVCDAATGRLTQTNHACCAMFGAAKDELVGHSIGSLSAGTSAYTQRNAMNWLQKAQLSGPQLFEWRCKAKGGRLFWGEISLRCTTLEGRPVGLAVIRDITNRKQQEEQLTREAHLDALTALPNRRDFDEMLQREILRSERYRGPLCVAMGDIDHFKIVNDSLGHHVGDAVLKSLAEFMRRRLRRSDYVARWGGEEFAILLPETTLEVAEIVLDRLRASIARHVIPELGRPVTLSFGITVYRRADSADELVERVDQALYQSKQSGRNQITKI